MFLRLLPFSGTKIKDSGLDRDTWGLNFEVDSIQLQTISVRWLRTFGDITRGGAREKKNLKIGRGAEANSRVAT